MLATDEDALVCDLAETYHIYDYRQLPAHQVAVFAVGLRDDSRIKLRLTGQMVKPEMLMLASMVDRLGLLVWSKTKEAQQGSGRPLSLVEALTKSGHEQSQVLAFASGEDFMRAREQLLREIGGEGNGERGG